MCYTVHSIVSEGVLTTFGYYRTCGLAVLLLLEAYMGWNFVSYLLSRREDTTTQQKVKQPVKKNKDSKNLEKKKN